MKEFFTPECILASLRFFAFAILAVLFVQSGFDKVFDWKGNLGWLKGHFSRTVFKGMVPLLLAVVTLLEVASGLSAAGAALSLLLPGMATTALQLGALGAFLALASLLCLFTGQRIAKDYAGAGGLVPYMLLAGFSLWLCTL